MERFLRYAISLATEEPTESECGAYEAGRYAYWLNAPVPERLQLYPALVVAFEKGKADVPLDIAAEERADALAVLDGFPHFST